MAKLLGRTSRVVAIGALSAGAIASGNASAQTQVIVITGSRIVSSGQSFDSFMSSNFWGGSSSTSFSAPEGETAYLASQYAQWIFKQVTPKAAITMDICAMSTVTATSRAVTKNSEDLERRAAANQVFYGNLPNFANTQRDGLIVAIVFSDGTQEQYRHTTMSGLQPMSGTLVPGTGTSRCPG